MKQTVFATGTITHAIKGRDILRRHGFKANMERMKYGMKDYGCGYGIVATGNPAVIERLLREQDVKILKIIPLG